MTNLEQIQDFLAQKRLAIVGVSHNPKSFSRSLYNEFKSRGYDTVAVNPAADEIAGERCYARLQDIRPPVDAVLLMTSPQVTDTVVRDCVEAGIKQVWMYRAAGQGAVSEAAVQFCRDHGIQVVAGECPYMFFPGAGWLHRFHGLVKKISGAYPRPAAVTR